MLILAIHSTLCTPLLEKGWALSNVKSKFVHPIYIHDKLELSSTITYHSTKKCTATISCTNFHNKTTFYGKMVFVRRSENLLQMRKGVQRYETFFQRYYCINWFSIWTCIHFKLAILYSDTRTYRRCRI